jgi:hypothetical protein
MTPLPSLIFSLAAANGQAPPATRAETLHNLALPISQLPLEIMWSILRFAEEEDDNASGNLFVRLMQTDASIFGPVAYGMLYDKKMCSISIYADGVSVNGSPHLDLYQQSMAANTTESRVDRFLGCDPRATLFVFTQVLHLELRFVGGGGAEATDAHNDLTQLRMLRNASILVDRLRSQTPTLLQELRIVVEESATTFARTVQWSSTWSTGGRRAALEPHPQRDIDHPAPGGGGGAFPVVPRASRFAGESRVEVVCAAFRELHGVRRASVTLAPPSLQACLKDWCRELVGLVTSSGPREEDWVARLRREAIMDQILTYRSDAEDVWDGEAEEVWEEG